MTDIEPNVSSSIIDSAHMLHRTVDESNGQWLEGAKELQLQKSMQTWVMVVSLR